jgi:chromosome segregation ATPase
MVKGESKPTASGASKTRRAAGWAASSNTGEPRLKLAEIDTRALSPEVRETLARLEAEREAARRELEDARTRIAQLERLADGSRIAAPLCASCHG